VTAVAFIIVVLVSFVKAMAKLEFLIAFVVTNLLG
jgi:hypothetical protein